MKIVTRYECPPIPDRSMDFSAIDEDTYDGAPDSNCPIGRGRTEAEAVRDLAVQSVDDFTLDDVAAALAVTTDATTALFLTHLRDLV